MFSAVFLVNVLENNLSFLVCNIEIDIRRFIASFRKKAFEKKLHTYRINRCNHQAIANSRISRRPSSLNGNSTGAREANNVPHNKKVGSKIEFDNHAQFMINLLHMLIGQTIITNFRALPDKLFQKSVEVDITFNTQSGLHLLRQGKHRQRCLQLMNTKLTTLGNSNCIFNTLRIMAPQLCHFIR